MASRECALAGNNNLGRVIIHTVAAQIFTHLSVVSSRQRLYGRLRCEGRIKESKTMTDNEIFQLAEKFRNAILRANATGSLETDLLKCFQEATVE